jgi:hypothetical protein
MKSTTSEQHDEPKDTIQRAYNVKFLRTMMDIHPIKGIDKGMCITLSGKNVSTKWMHLYSFSNNKKKKTSLKPFVRLLIFQEIMQRVKWSFY